jgi:hypothetical protein
MIIASLLLCVVLLLISAVEQPVPARAGAKKRVTGKRN